MKRLHRNDFCMYQRVMKVSFPNHLLWHEHFNTLRSMWKCFKVCQCNLHFFKSMLSNTCYIIFSYSNLFNIFKGGQLISKYIWLKWLSFMHYYCIVFFITNNHTVHRFNNYILQIENHEYIYQILIVRDSVPIAYLNFHKSEFHVEITY